MYQLRSADRLVDSLKQLRAKDLYALAERSLKQEEGPQQQTSSDAALDKIKTKSVAAPASFEDDRPKDTFADELGSDTM